MDEQSVADAIRSRTMPLRTRWSVHLWCTPALEARHLETALAYVCDSDYSNELSGYDWWNVPTQDRAADGNKSFGSGGALTSARGRGGSAMACALRDTLNWIIKNHQSIHSLDWHDERLDAHVPYRCQDLAKLLRVLRKMRVSADGSVNGEGFAAPHDRIFIQHSHLHECKAVFYPGDELYVDEVSSDDEHAPRLPTPIWRGDGATESAVSELSMHTPPPSASEAGVDATVPEDEIVSPDDSISQAGERPTWCHKLQTWELYTDAEGIKRRRVRE